MNPFNIGDIVKTITGTPRSGGKIKYTACVSATLAGGRTCDKKECNHNPKDFVWVVWEGGTTCSYKYDELAADASPISNDKITKAISSAKQLAKEKPIDFKLYNGLAKLKVDKQGRPYILESALVEITAPPIAENEIDWKVYAGYKKGSLRKMVDKEIKLG